MQYLRCNILLGADGSLGMQCAVQLFGNTEIPQLVIPKIILENIVRIDIPMQNIRLMTVNQSPADILSQLPGFLCRLQLSSIAAHLLTYVVQQLHADDQVITHNHAIFHNFKHRMVIHADHMAQPPQPVQGFHLTHGSVICQLTQLLR